MAAGICQKVTAGTAFGRFSITLLRFLGWNFIIVGREMIHKQGGCLVLHKDVCLSWLVMI